jgi:hypothetical protein
MTGTVIIDEDLNDQYSCWDSDKIPASISSLFFFSLYFLPSFFYLSALSHSHSCPISPLYLILALGPCSPLSALTFLLSFSLINPHSLFLIILNSSQKCCQPAVKSSESNHNLTYYKKNLKPQVKLISRTIKPSLSVHFSI